MSALETKVKKYKVAALIREINRSKEDVIDFLSSIGVEKITINTSLEPEVVAKVFAHFKKDIEDQEKHIKKVVDFVQKNKVEIFEADERIKKEEEAKVKKAEEQRLKKIIEDETKKKEEEKKKQELLAFLEREKALKEQAEKDKKSSLERIMAAKKKREEVKVKKEEQKPKVDKHDTAEKDTKARIKEDKKPEAEKKPFVSDAHKAVKEKDSHSKTYQSPGTKVHPPKEEKASAQKDIKPPQRHDHRDVRKPFDHTKPRKAKYEKVTLKDIKQHKKPFQKDKDDKKKETPKGSGEFVKQTVKPVKPEKWDGVKKEKDKKTKADYEYERKKKKIAKGLKAKEFSQKEIDDAIRETMAKMDDEGSQSARSLARKRKKKERMEQEKKILEYEESRKNVIKVTEFLSTSELANLMSIEASELIRKCFDLGMMVSINQRLEKDLIVLLAEEFGFKIEFQTEYQEDLLQDEEDPKETLKPRPPVVTIMGHVDHGKTSLLDYIRKANVVAGEAGGITQHIGAYKVKLDSGKEISFLDTPGHEAFTAMRARGGQAADIVVLVVAADDSVMPQTVEAINHALAANVPIVIAINKIDKPNSNIEKIKKQLADNNVLIEEWGGKYQSVEISAKFGKNIDVLLEKILLEADILELKSNPDRNARGVVLESKLDRGKGIMATVLVQKGTLNVGDCFLSGIFAGRVKAMFDEREKRIEAAKPATPVLILGFNGMPQAGDAFVVMDTENEARNIALKRQQLKREQDFRQVRFATLDDISKQIKEGKQVELNIIIKADTDGSAEALADSLAKLATNEAKVRIIHKALGQISESDVLLAEASSAIIIGFNVRPNLNARKLAEKNIVDIRIHNIIYKVIDEVKSALEGMLEPEISEEITATVEVRDVFKIPKIGNVAGCYVQDGKIIRNNKVRLVREGFVIFDGSILSLKRIKDDVREVESGYECGIGLENYNDIKVGDIIEAYKLVETKRKLTVNK